MPDALAVSEARIDSHLGDEGLEAMARDVREGLGRHPMELSPKYLYDARGSELFDRITRLPEYYATRSERWESSYWRTERARRVSEGRERPDGRKRAQGRRVTVVLAACGGDDAVEEVPTGAEGTEQGQAAASATVELDEFSFAPSDVTWKGEP